MSAPQLESLGVLHAINQSGGLVSVLRKFIPYYNWNEKLMKEKLTKKSQQKQLFEMVLH